MRDPGNEVAFVAPTLSKQDIEGLKKHIPKFFSHTPSSQQEFWETILQNPEDLMQQGSSPYSPLCLRCGRKEI